MGSAPSVRAAAAQLWTGRIALGVLAVGLWEFTSGRFFNDFWLSRPSLILERIVDMANSGDLWYHLQTTLEETLLGLAIGMFVGTFLGVVMGFAGQYAGWVYPYIMAVYSLPKVALAPLFVVWFGIGLLSKVLMVTMMVVFVAFYNAFEGMHNIDRDLLDMMRTFRADRRSTLAWVVLPSITTWVLTSLRLGIGLSLIGSVIAELVGANRGIGYYITKSAGTLDTTGIFAGLFIIMLLAVVLEAIVVQIERRLLRYR
jgi:NitT/TauT family transport system permease protein